MKKRFGFIVSLLVISLFILSCTPQAPEVVEELPSQEQLLPPQPAEEPVFLRPKN